MKFFRQRYHCLSPLAIVVLHAACGGGKPVDAANKQDASAEKPRTVRLTTARFEKIVRAVEATGTLAARERIALAMRVTGRLQEVKVDLGDLVRRGDVIAQIDPTDLRIAVQQATAALQQARIRLGLPAEGNSETVVEAQTPTVRQANATLLEARLRRERAQLLFDQKLIPPSDLEAAQAAYQVADSRYQDAIEEIRNRQAQLAQRRADLEMARQQLTYAVLTAPADGAVVERVASAGQFISAGSPVASIVTIHPLRLRLPVPERAAAHVRAGQRVRLRLDQETQAFYGTVTRLSPAIDEESRTLMVEAEVPNESGRLRPGSFVRAAILAEAGEPALLIPSSALVTFAGIEKVMSVEGGRVVEKPVRTGWREGDRLEILEGLEAGTPVVLRPGNLTGGQRVVVSE
jgi:RND family efflux transporter MFP subunit